MRYLNVSSNREPGLQGRLSPVGGPTSDRRFIADFFTRDHNRRVKTRLISSPARARASDGEDTEDVRSFLVITSIHATGCGEYFVWTGKIEDFDLRKDINRATHTELFQCFRSPPRLTKLSKLETGTPEKKHGAAVSATSRC
jgi:hypothetical protein